MAEAQYRTLSKRVVDRLSVNGKDAIFWDRDLAGFGVRVYPSGNAYSGAIRSPIPAQTDHSFRWKPITDSGANRSVIPVGNRSLLGCAPEWCMGSNPRS